MDQTAGGLRQLTAGCCWPWRLFEPGAVPVSTWLTGRDRHRLDHNSAVEVMKIKTEVANGDFAYSFLLEYKLTQHNVVIFKEYFGGGCAWLAQLVTLPSNS